MTIDDLIKHEKLQYGINREAAEICVLSSGKINMYEYLTGEKVLLSNEKQIIEQSIFILSPVCKAFEKQIKTIGDQGKKQIDDLKDLKENKETQKKAIEDKSDGKLSTLEIFFNKSLNERMD